jgi:hypothetical protein
MIHGIFIWWYVVVMLRNFSSISLYDVFVEGLYGVYGLYIQSIQ